jgi:hypothetical protein
MQVRILTVAHRPCSNILPCITPLLTAQAVYHSMLNVAFLEEDQVLTGGLKYKLIGELITL